MCKNEQDFQKNPLEYAHKKLQDSNNSELKFDCTTATAYFINTYSDNTVNNGDHLRSWAIPECDASTFNTDSITPSLGK